MWSTFRERLRNEPVVIIGVLASAVLAAVAELTAGGILGADIGAFLTNALNPNGGWALPIIIAFITRMFSTGPVTAARLKAEVPPGYVQVDP